MMTQPTVLPETTVTQIINEARSEWMNQDEQKKAFDELAKRLGTRDKAKRAMTSRFRTMVKDKYGGYLWLQVITATGTIPKRMLELASKQLNDRMLENQGARRAGALASSQGLAVGPQHRVSYAKRQRREAKKCLKAVQVEMDKRRYDSRHEWMPQADFVRLQRETDRVVARASRVSEESGNRYKLYGKSHGAPPISNFAILMADYCRELDIDVATGVHRQARGR